MAVYTLTDYAIALIILFAVLYLLAKFLFARISLDEHFAIAVLPIIVLSIVIRLLVDAGVYPKNKLWSVTPGVYIVGLVVGTIVIASSVMMERRRNWAYWRTSLIVGVALIPYFLIKLLPKVAHPARALYPLSIAIATTSLVYLIASRSEMLEMLSSRPNIAIIFAHLLDASGTFVGMDFYGFYEEHPLPEFLINHVGTAAIMIPLKLVVVGAAIYYLETRREEGPEADLYYNIIKFVFFILGIGPGTRNAMILTLR
ncbi:MAG: DUF63 family protein [Candidatus Hydrothermarchaeaceae archaeon]